MTGSYISLRGLELPPQCRFKSIPIDNNWEQRICDAWGSNEFEVRRALRDWLQDTIRSNGLRQQKLLDNGRAMLSLAIERKTTPIFFIMDIRELIAGKVAA